MNPAFEGRLAEYQQRPALWLVAYAALLAVQISPWWYATPDTAMYLSTARGIARHHTLATLGNLQVGFPPGYPFLMSPAFLLNYRPFLILSIMHWCLAIALMLGVYRWARRCCPDGALLLTGLVMLNVTLWIHYRRALSELAFMTVLIWTVQILDGPAAGGPAAGVFSMARSRWSLRAAKPDRPAAGVSSMARSRWSLRAAKSDKLQVAKPPHAARVLAGSALLLLLCMIREVGLLVGAGFDLLMLVDVWRARIRWPAALVLTLLINVPAVVGVAAFVHYDAAMKVASPAPIGTHLDGLTNPTAPLAAHLTEGLRLRISEIGRLLVPGMFNAYGRPGDWLDFNVAIYVLVFFLVAVGWLRWLRREPSTLALTLPLYFMAYLVWPFDAGSRYLLPMLPALWASVWMVIEPWRRYRLRILALLLIVHLGVALGHWTIKDIPRARACHAQWQSVDGLVAAIDNDARIDCSAEIPQCVQLMLELGLDRQLSRNDDARAVGWLVVPDAQPVTPGFSTSVHAAPYKLLRRTPES